MFGLAKVIFYLMVVVETNETVLRPKYLPQIQRINNYAIHTDV